MQVKTLDKIREWDKVSCIRTSRRGGIIGSASD